MLVLETTAQPAGWPLITLAWRLASWNFGKGCSLVLLDPKPQSVPLNPSLLSAHKTLQFAPVPLTASVMSIGFSPVPSSSQGLSQGMWGSPDRYPPLDPL